MLGLAISDALCPYYLPSNPAVPFLNGRYPASPVLRTTPPPCRPGLLLTEFRLPRATAPTGLPVLLLP